MTMGSNPVLRSNDAMTAFSALHLLRSYNHLLTPTGGSISPPYPHHLINNPVFEDFNLPALKSPTTPATTFGLSPALPIIGAFQPYSPVSLPLTPVDTELKTDSGVINRALSSSICFRRPRGEKKPIPDEQKDDKYYERRKRNNQAAKKSRDARKIREDQIALRASILEHENAVLRAQVVTLREEAQSLRHLLLLQRKSERTSYSVDTDGNTKDDELKRTDSNRYLLQKDEKLTR